MTKIRKYKIKIVFEGKINHKMSVAILQPDNPDVIKILTQSLIKTVTDDKKRVVKTVKALIVDQDGNWRIPMAFAIHALGLKVPVYTSLPRVPIQCSTQLGFGGRDFQIEAYNTTVDLLLKTHSAFLSLQCGGGKTQVAVKIFADLGLKAAVVTDVSLIFPQWVKVLREKTNARVCAIDSAAKINKNLPLPDADIYVFMVTAAGNLNPKQLEHIKFLIVDEATYLMTPDKAWRLLNFKPSYTLGLCAEIRRDDGMHRLIPCFFGSNMFRRISDIPFIVHRLNTNYQPTIKPQRYKAGPDWNVFLESIANNVQRNEDIIQLCQSLPDSKIIVGTKRVDQAKYLAQRLKDLGEDVQTLIGNDNKVLNCRILVGIYSKMGRGIDIKNLSPDWSGDVFDTLIIALDLTKIEQFVGRVFRHSNPIIYHIVDDDRRLRKHFDNDCKPWYLSRNGKIDQAILPKAPLLPPVNGLNE